MLWVLIIFTCLFFIPVELLKLCFLVLLLPIFLLPGCDKSKRYVFNNFLAVDQTVNVLCGGAVDETISSRVYKAQDTNWIARLVVKFLEIFEKNHAEKSAEYNIKDDSVI